MRGDERSHSTRSVRCRVPSWMSSCERGRTKASQLPRTRERQAQAGSTHIEHHSLIPLDVLLLLLGRPQRELGDERLLVDLRLDLPRHFLQVRVVDVEVVAEDAGEGLRRDELLCEARDEGEASATTRVRRSRGRRRAGRTVHVPHEAISDLERVDVEVDLDGDEDTRRLGRLVELVLGAARVDRGSSASTPRDEQAARKESEGGRTMPCAWCPLSAAPGRGCLAAARPSSSCRRPTPRACPRPLPPAAPGPASRPAAQRAPLACASPPAPRSRRACARRPRPARPSRCRRRRGSRGRRS